MTEITQQDITKIGKAIRGSQKQGGVLSVGLAIVAGVAAEQYGIPLDMSQGMGLAAVLGTVGEYLRNRVGE